MSAPVGYLVRGSVLCAGCAQPDSLSTMHAHVQRARVAGDLTEMGLALVQPPRYDLR